jgi:hypothetical protein
MVKMPSLQRASHASPFYWSWELRVPVARAPLNPIDDDTERSGGEQKHADVNDTKE